ncbi:MAG TPA: helix-turn-helix transcriptional regulator [Thermoanaerobaculia bacterium]|nr:helix-turn-helix transcriptional regulator [Thermoanaerobaculia bacterium]
MDEREDWGPTVVFLRMIRKWRQSDLARAAGMHQSLISLYERGKDVPQRATLERLSAAAGVPYSLLEEHQALVRRAHARPAERLPAGLAPVDVDSVMASLTASICRMLDEVVRPAATELLQSVTAERSTPAPPVRTPGRPQS